MNGGVIQCLQRNTCTGNSRCTGFCGNLLVQNLVQNTPLTPRVLNGLTEYNTSCAMLSVVSIFPGSLGVRVCAGLSVLRLGQESPARNYCSPEPQIDWGTVLYFKLCGRPARVSPGSPGGLSGSFETGAYHIPYEFELILCTGSPGVFLPVRNHAGLCGCGSDSTHAQVQNGVASVRLVAVEQLMRVARRMR